MLAHFQTWRRIMKKFTWIRNPQARFAVAMGAAIGMGHAITRGLTENLGMIVGLLGGAAATAILALGFMLVLSARIKPE
jgi:ABC-type enterobactin transport system permease subunit